MASVSYNVIFSKFLSRVTDYTLLSLTDEQIHGLELEWFHTAITDIRVRNLFSSITLDDDSEVLTFVLSDTVADDQSDIDFIVDVVSLGMVINWMQPKVDSVLNVSAMIGSDKEKALLNPYNNATSRLNSLKIEQQKKIRDYGYLYGSYTEGYR